MLTLAAFYFTGRHSPTGFPDSSPDWWNWRTAIEISVRYFVMADALAFLRSSSEPPRAPARADCNAAEPDVTLSVNNGITRRANSVRPRWFQFGVCGLTSTLLVVLLSLVSASFITTVATAQEADETRRQRGPVRAPLLWENVRDSAQYVSGVEPVYSASRRLSVVTLQPGNSVDFLVPAHELIRVISTDSAHIAGDEVQIWVSDGSGLYRKQNSAVADDGLSIISAPDQSGISVAKVWRPETAAGPVTLGVFTSRRSPNRLLDYYQCTVEGRSPQVSISSDRGSGNREYSLIEAGQSYPLRIKGPTRLRIESRLKYDDDSQQKQSYWIRVRIDGVVHRILMFDTRPLRRSRTFVDECESLIGRREFAYLDIDGQVGSVEIEASHSLYVRADAIGLDLCRPAINRNFDFPSFENPAKEISFWNAPEFDPASSALSQSFLYDDDESAPELIDPVWDPYLNQQVIQQVARNNRIPMGGLRAYMWMRAIATRHYGDADFGDEITIPELAERLREQYTYYRDLFPIELGEGNEPRTVSFPIRPVRNPGAKMTETVIGEQHIPETVSQLPTATLFQLSTDPSDGNGNSTLRFRVPDNHGPSMIRVVVDQVHLTEPTRLTVQYDDREPIEMAVIQNSPLCAGDRIPGRAEAALAGLSKIHKRYDSGTVGGPFAVWKQPLPIVRAATNEILIPASVREITLRVKSCSEPVVYTGVQFLTANYTELSESSWRMHQHVLENNDAGSRSFSTTELDNDSVDVQQFLVSHWRRVNESIEASDQIAEPDDLWGSARINDELNVAIAMMESFQWTAAIESFSRLIDHSAGEMRTTLIMERANALENAGEYFMADIERRGWISFSNDETLKRGMLQQLIASAQARPYGESTIEQYLAFAVIDRADPDTVLQLARAMADNGRYRFALHALLVGQSGPEVDELLLRSSFQTQWWRTFDETLLRSGDPATISFWQGMRALRQGSYKQAYELLQNGGERGAVWLQHWEQGHLIFSNLKSSVVSKRLNAIGQWETWQAQHPGPHVWQAEPAAIKSCAGAAIIYSQERDIRSQFFRSKRNRNATIRIHGPVRIRIEARPVHSVPAPGIDAAPIDDWISVTNGQQVERFPVMRNYPSRTLTIDGDDSFLPGERVFAELELPAGLNEIRVSSANADLLFRLLALRPELASPVLPFVNEVTMAAVIRGTFGNVQRKEDAKTSEPAGVDCVRLICRDRECCSVPLGFTDLPWGCNELHSARKCFEQLSLDDADQWRDRVVPASLPFINVHQDEAYRQAIEAAFIPGDSSMVDGQFQMRRIVRLQQIANENPGRADINELLSHFQSGSTWESLNQFDSRAGVRMVSGTGWLPATPALRIRKSLLGGGESDYVVTGSTDLAFEVNDTAATEFEIALRRPRVSFLPMSSTTAVWSVANRAGFSSGSNEIVLGRSDESVQFRLDLEPGANQMTVTHGNPLANHFIGVNINEVLSDGRVVGIDHQRVRARDEQRMYQVATAEEPLRMRVPGPTVIRIDRLVDNALLTETIATGQGVLSLELLPERGEEMALIRVYELRLDGNDTPIYRKPHEPVLFERHWVDDVVDSVFAQADSGFESDPLDLLSLRSPDLPPLEIASLERSGLERNGLESRGLGLQELGTIGMNVGFRQRRAIDEFPNAGTAERFFEIGLTRNYYDEWRDRYSQNELLLRPRIGSGPTFGFRHEGSTTLPLAKCDPGIEADGRGPYKIDWNLYGFTQHAGTPVVPGASSSPWSAGFSSSISRRHQITTNLNHRPRLSVFGRILSEDFNGFAAGELDQDIFTQYKSDHRFGLRVSDRFVYQTCLDKRWWIRPSLMTNEDQLVPDNLGFTAGTDQLLGPLQVHLGYRLTGYFSDNDRTQASTQNVVNLEMNLDRWQSRNRRVGLSFAMQHDLGGGGTNFGLSLSSFLNQNRGYRDFDSDSVLFRSLREEQAARHYVHN